MKKILLLICTLLATAGAWADVTVTWESYPGWVRGDVASVWWVGITTPGTTSDTYKMSEFQFAQETGYGASTCYACISTTGPQTSGAVLDEDDVLGVSTNAVTATAANPGEYYTYNLGSEIELTGATTYYMVFISSDVPTDGKYTVTNQRVSLNLSYGTYAAGTMSSNGNRQSNWTPGFKATLTTSAVYKVSYTCYKTTDNSTITSGVIANVVGAVSAPEIEGYEFSHATDAAGNAVSLTDEVTSDMTLKLYYTPYVDVTYNLYDGSAPSTLEKTVTVQQLAGSEVSIPADLVEGYSSVIFTFAIDGTIGDADATIRVVHTMKSGLVTDLAQLSNNKAYTLTTARGSLGTDGTQLVSTARDGYSAGTFAIISYGGNSYLYSVADGKYLANAQLTDDPSTIVPLVISDDAAEHFFFLGMGSNGINVSAGYTPGVVINSWTARDDGNQYAIFEAADFDPDDALATLGSVVNVTYQVVYDGEVVDELTATGIRGNAPELPSELDNSLFTYTTATAALTDDAVVRYEATWNGPFEISDSYENAKWYYLRLKAGNYVTYVADGEANVQLPTSYTPNDENAEWAFFGNPYAGLTLVNRAAGSGVVLGSDNAADDGNAGGNTYATLADAGMQEMEAWIPIRSTYYDGSGFFLFNTEGQALNHRSTDNLAYWTDGYDAGSTFRVEAVIDNYYPFVEDEVLPFIAADAPTDVLFTLPKDVVEDIQLLFKDQLTQKDFNYEDYQWCKEIVEKGMLYPEDGMYYLIRNVSNGCYLDVQSNSNGIYAVQGQPLASSVVKAVVRDDHTYFATQGMELGWCWGTGNKALLDAAEGGKYAHFSVTKPGQVAFAHALGNGEGSYASYLADAYYAVDTEGLVAGGKATDENAQWTFEEAKDFYVYTIQDESYSYATFYAPFDVTLSNAAAYKVAVAEGVAVPTEIGPYIPAGTPVLLVASKNVMAVKAAVGFTTNNAVEADVEGNDLQGSYLAAKAFEYGVLDNQDGMGFYVADQETEISANFAYMPNITPVLHYPLDKTTGIASLASALNRQPATVYDLAGRRVQKAQRGIYISGGKKAVIK